MTTEMKWLTYLLLFQALMWVPYILNRLKRNGLKAMGYEVTDQGQCDWANRMQKAHSNAVENLVVIVPLVFLLESSGVSSETSACAIKTYFWLRVVHFVSYSAAIPYVRTLSFAGSWMATIYLICQILKMAH